MGKAQSKRSVDITTETTTKDGKIIEEGTAGKMGKIEDIDQLKPQLNGGDSHQNENEISDKEKIEENDTENEKDKATEKEATTNGHPDSGEGDAKTAETDSNDETLNESKISEATSPTSENCDKKPKKEKVKKKWSFRSISFSKKDKQKPSKKEETNGEIEKVLEEPQQEAVVAAATTEATAEIITNGTEKTEEPKEETSAPVSSGKVEEPKAEVVEEKKEIVVSPAPVDEPKEEKPVEESAPVVPAVEEKTVVVEEVKTETITEVKTIEPVKEPAAVEHVIVEETKRIETTEQHTIEVKAENESKPEEQIISQTEVVEENKKDLETGDNISPPPLPSIPPPSQVTVFAESAMSPENDTTTPISVNSPLVDDLSNKETISEPIVEVKSELPVELIPETVAEIDCEKVLEHVQEAAPPSQTEEPKDNSNIVTESVETQKAPESVESQIIQETTLIVESSQNSPGVASEQEQTLPSPPMPELESLPPQTEIKSENIEIVNESKIESDEPKPEQIAETIALIEKVTDDVLSSDEINSMNDSLPPPPPADDEAKDISIDISSPLPQNSLDSLPSPSSKSSSLPLPPSDSINTTNDVAAAQIETTTITQQVSNENNLSSEINELPPPIENKEEISEPTIPVQKIPMEETVVEKLNGIILNEQHELTNGDETKMIQEQQQIVSDKIETKTEVILTESSTISVTTQEITKSEESVQENCPSPTKAPEAIVAE